MDKKFYEKLNLFVHILVFDMRITKSDDYLKSRFFIYEPSFAKLLLLKLHLYINYEDTYLFLSPQSFNMLRLYIKTYLDYLPQNDYESSETIEIVRLLFSVGKKIYKSDLNDSKLFSIDLVRNSLLSDFWDSYLVHTSNFWRAYFDTMYAESTEESNKLKAIEICESMVFYNFFLTKDMEFTCKFIESCLPVKSINMKLVQNNVTLRLGKYLYKAHNTNSKKEYIKKIDNTKKLTMAFLVAYKLKFLDPKSISSIIVLNTQTSVRLLKGIASLRLHGSNFDMETRIFLWLKYVNLKSKRSLKYHVKPVVDLSNEEIEQIHIDVIRTKQWKGASYHAELEALTVDYIVRYTEHLDYFQGFNYILSFFYDFIGNKADLHALLDYVTNFLIKVI